jgi:hypothetical protein
VQTKKGQKKHYINRKDNMKQKSQSNVWISRLRPRIRSIIPENSIGKHKGAEFQIKQGQDKFLGKIQQICYYIIFIFISSKYD